MRPILGFVCTCLLAGCATYRPLPLDTAVTAPASAADIKVDVAALDLPALRRHVFDPGDGLDMTEVAMLAVANNPRLKVARDDLGIARAQAFAAGLLPDPVLGAARRIPMGGGAATTAYRLGLSYDVTALLTRSTARQAARYRARQVDLDLLWKEWQVVGEAWQLFIRADFERRSLALMRQESRILTHYHEELAAALRRGDVGMAEVAGDEARLQAVQSRTNRLAREQSATTQALVVLLGLSPEARLDLVGAARVPALDQDAVRRDLAELPRRRADLLALAAGYRSQDARYREAILGQFPAIDVGFVRSRDTGDINTYGFEVSLSLPIFNRNRGAIAVQEATRQRLHDEYTARLLEARGAIRRILLDQDALTKQRRQLDDGADVLARNLRAARTAHGRGDLPDSSFVAVRTAWLDSRLARLRVDEVLFEQRAALRTLLGCSFATE